MWLGSRVFFMRWSYKTVHFELKKEGLLGSTFLDESEIEFELNEFGKSGWELISVLEIHDGIIAFFKQPIDDSKPSESVAERSALPEDRPASQAQPSSLARPAETVGAKAYNTPAKRGLGAIKIE